MKFWIVFCLGKDFLFKSSLADCDTLAFLLIVLWKHGWKGTLLHSWNEIHKSLVNHKICSFCCKYDSRNCKYPKNPAKLRVIKKFAYKLELSCSFDYYLAVFLKVKFSDHFIHTRLPINWPRKENFIWPMAGALSKCQEFLKIGSKSYKDFTIYGCIWTFLKDRGVNMTPYTPLTEPCMAAFAMSLVPNRKSSPSAFTLRRENSPFFLSFLPTLIPRTLGHRGSRKTSF